MQIRRQKYLQVVIALFISMVVGVQSSAAKEATASDISNAPTFEILIFDGFDDMDAFGVPESLRLASCSVKFKSLRKQDLSPPHPVSR